MVSLADLLALADPPELAPARRWLEMAADRRALYLISESSALGDVSWRACSHAMGTLGGTPVINGRTASRSGFVFFTCAAAAEARASSWAANIGLRASAAFLRWAPGWRSF